MSSECETVELNARRTEFNARAWKPDKARCFIDEVTDRDEFGYALFCYSAALLTLALLTSYRTFLHDVPREAHSELSDPSGSSILYLVSPTSCQPPFVRLKHMVTGDALDENSVCRRSAQAPGLQYVGRHDQMVVDRRMTRLRRT